MGIGACGFTTEDASILIAQYKADIQKKIESGETENSILIGATEFTQTAWDKLLEQLDINLEVVKEEQEVRFTKLDEQREAQQLYEEMVQKARMEKEIKNHLVETVKEFDKVPYGHLAKEGMIVYNGVTFFCDEEHNAITLGDVSDPKNVITVPLSEGGCLKFNRENINELVQAIGMFSPEDVKRIMQAISMDAKIQQMKKEIEDDKASLGDSADASMEINTSELDTLTTVQMEMLFRDMENEN